MTRLAVVGFGNAGRQHAAAVAALDDLVLGVVVDTDPEAGRASEAAVRDLTDVLADDGIGLVAVCLPPGSRAAVVAACQSAGKHVVVEKPPANDLAELESLLDNGKRAGVGSAVMFQHRFALPPALHSGAPERFAGARATLVVSRFRPDGHYASGGWRAEPAEAIGGVTAHLGVHYLDLACQLLGEPVEITPLSRVDSAAGIDVELSCRIGFDSGAELLATITSRSSARLEHLTVLGAEDRFELRDGAARGEVAGVTIDAPARPAVELRTELYREVRAAVRGEAPLDLAALARGRGVTSVLAALSPAGVR